MKETGEGFTKYYTGNIALKKKPTKTQSTKIQLK